jgi:hypothetical protein
MARARCSRCDESFFLAAPRRTYVLTPEERPVAVAAAGARAGSSPAFTFGMDDPGLAPQVRNNGFSDTSAAGEPLTYRVMAQEGADPAPEVPPTGPAMDAQDPSATLALDTEAVQAALQAGEIPSEAPLPLLEMEESEESEPAAAMEAVDEEQLPAVPTVRPEKRRKKRRSRPFLEGLVALVLAAGGAALGYYSAFPLPVPVDLPVELPGGWTDAEVVRLASGTLLGLLVGWLCLRRLRPKS